jgi:hypothetical protein
VSSGALSLAKSLRKGLNVPQTFIGFCDWLGVKLQPGQAEFARVAFDGAEPLDRALAESIFGPIDFANLPVGCRRVVDAICGGRGGKSYIFVGLRLVFGMCLRDLSPLAPGQRAYTTVVAPNEKLRQEVVNYALGACRSKPELRELLRLPRGTKDDDIVSEFDFYRPDFGRVVTFWGATATRGGSSVRGKWHTDLALDEAAFFLDSSYKINDDEIFKAGKPRVLPGGQTIVATTPWGETGLAYELHRDNFGKPDTALAAQAPTLTINDTVYTREIVEAEQKRDPENAEREYGAKFMRGGTTVFFQPALIDAAKTDESFEPRPGDEIAAGADFGFRSDSSSLVMVALRGQTLHVFNVDEAQPVDGLPLKPSVTVKRFADQVKGWCGYVMADGHYRESIAEHLEESELAFAPAPTTPADTYIRARQLLRGGRIKFHAFDARDRMLLQMRQVMGKPISGGGMSIVHQRWAKGGHGDLVAALVLALWQVSGDTVKAKEPDRGTAEWEEAAREQRRIAHNAEAEKPWWQQHGEQDRGEGAWWRR